MRGDTGEEVERVLPRRRERVARLERSIGVPAKSRGTTARGFRNQGCLLMSKWTLFARRDEARSVRTRTGREELSPLSFSLYICIYFPLSLSDR